MSGAERPYWHELYRNAVMESDPEKLRMRMAEAYIAIRARVVELRYQGLPHTKEQNQLDRALYFLNLLHNISQKKETPTNSREAVLVAGSEAA